MPKTQPQDLQQPLAPLSKSGARLRLLVVVAVGLYCWFLTVLPVALVGGAPQLARVFSGIALVALAIAPVFAPSRLSITLALDIFLLFCILTWGVGSQDRGTATVAIFGSLGWFSYTLALGALSSPRQEPMASSQKDELPPRRSPSKLSALALIVSVLSGAYLMKAAWDVQRPSIAVLAHVFALCAALIVLRTGRGLATYFQVQGTSLARPPRLAPAMIALVGVLVAAVVLVFLKKF